MTKKQDDFVEKLIPFIAFFVGIPLLIYVFALAFRN